MSWLFGGVKKSKGMTTEQVEANLVDLIDMLNRKQEKLELDIDKLLKLAKQYGTKQKKKAIQALKRKKALEKQLAQIDGTLTSVEFQLDALRNAQANQQVLHTMRNASLALKREHNHMTVDEVHDIMDDISEQTEVGDEIAEAISGQINLDYDEDELMDELNELEQEELDAKMIDIPTTSDLPAVPTSALPDIPTSSKKVKKSKEEDDLEELMSWAN